MRDRAATPFSGSSASMDWVRQRSKRADTAVISRAVAGFLITGLIAMLGVVFGVVLLVRHDVREDAVREARDITVAAGRAAIAPVLTDAVLRGDPQALQVLDTNVRERVLSDTLVRVKVWTADGTIVYSDDAALIGKTFALGADDLAVLHNGHPVADISNLTQPENVSERSYGQLLQVYDGLRTTSGQPVLFEAYLTTNAIRNSSSLGTIAPVVIGGFLLLFTIQIPLAWRLARRVRRARDDRAIMLERALRSRDAERRRIAADLHDGIVQQLAGNAYSLAVAADQAEQAGAASAAAVVRTAANELRQGVRDLRTLIITITPPTLHEEGLLAAIDDLASSARSSGLAVDVSVDLPRDLDAETEHLLFRTAQESMRNVIEHARANTVIVRVCRQGSSIVLSVIDDGCGFDARSRPLASAGEDPHLGLRLLDELARDAAGTLRVDSAAGVGTTVELVVPS